MDSFPRGVIWRASQFAAASRFMSGVSDGESSEVPSLPLPLSVNAAFAPDECAGQLETSTPSRVDHGDGESAHGGAAQGTGPRTREGGEIMRGPVLMIHMAMIYLSHCTYAWQCGVDGGGQKRKYYTVYDSIFALTNAARLSTHCFAFVFRNTSRCQHTT